MNKTTLLCLALAFCLAAALPAQTLPKQPLKVTHGFEVDIPSMGSYKSPLVGIDEQRRIKWLENAKKQAKNDAKREEAEYTYFKNKYEEVNIADFRAIKQLILSNGYPDITSVLSTVTYYDLGAVPWEKGSPYPFLAKRGDRIVAVNLGYFSRISKLGALNGMPQLEYVCTYNCPIADGVYDSLAGLPNLRTLYFYNPGNVTDLKGIDRFKKLQYTGLWGGKIADFTKITMLYNLFELSPKQLKRVLLTGNPFLWAKLPDGNQKMNNFLAAHPEIIR